LKLKLFLTLLIFTLLLPACSTGKPKEHLSEIYSAALDSIMEQEKVMDSGMKFIAIDMSNFNEVDDNEKKEIITYFKNKYKIEVLEATFEQLKEMGLYNFEDSALDGILLRKEKVDYKFNNHIVFEGSKNHSGLGAVGVKVTVHYKNNRWTTKDVKMTWIS
jgi:hypothetical protein